VFRWLALSLVVVGYLGVYSAWTAGRLDRLHLRLDAARTALDGQLRERALVARGTAGLRDLAQRALDVPGLGHDREQVENALSRALRSVAPTDELNEVVTRASFARQFHNDAVRDALVLRRRWIVRLLHLAGHAPRPTFFEIDPASDDGATLNRSAEISDVAGSTPP
jgi:hypothetical protein